MSEIFFYVFNTSKPRKISKRILLTFFMFMHAFHYSNEAFHLKKTLSYAHCILININYYFMMTMYAFCDALLDVMLIVTFNESAGNSIMMFRIMYFRENMNFSYGVGNFWWESEYVLIWKVAVIKFEILLIIFIKFKSNEGQLEKKIDIG
jgi:hypothetical protein